MGGSGFRVSSFHASSLAKKSAWSSALFRQLVAAGQIAEHRDARRPCPGSGGMHVDVAVEERLPGPSNSATLFLPASLPFALRALPAELIDEVGASA